jgi:hypothetical protein
MDDDAEKDPWTLLSRTGWVAFTLGVFDLVQFGRPNVLVLMQFPNICVSICAGWALLRRFSSALVVTAIAGGVILADTLVSMLAVGPRLVRDLDFRDHQGAALIIPMLLLYGLQFLFWPFASSLALRDQRPRGLSELYADHTRDTVIGAFLVSFWISGVLQTLLKVQMFRLL